MSRFWHFISYLGVEESDKSLGNRTIKLCNQLNIVLAMIAFVVVFFLRIMGHIEGAPMGMGSIRFLLMLILAIINLILSANHRYYLAKVSTIFLHVFLILIFPTLIGFVEAESFSYYAFIAVGTSIIPQLFLLPDKDKYLYLHVLIK